MANVPAITFPYLDNNNPGDEDDAEFHLERRLCIYNLLTSTGDILDQFKSLDLHHELDLYPVEALTTCNHALAVCNSEPKCIALFDQFKADCKVRDKKCRMDSRLVSEVFIDKASSRNVVLQS
ncbi:Spike glycoprotein [Frankliniella fusca]|uniref:Spike glycoprotein n=1 Tax=Frankliniella fusca TaxID=407009 RepID=A0AAE1GVZ4_9NEOP|nr:Spike glycoprotein [Frankliniella fusca]